MSLSNFAKKVLLTNLGFSSPYEINFVITYACNSRCRTCGIWKRKTEKELTLDEIKRTVESMKFINWVRLTGGEPFLRKDYVEIVRAFSKLPKLYFLSTPTNGLMPEFTYKKVREVLQFFRKKYTISVSLDGPEKIHDRIRGIKGSWKKAIETYIKLKSLEKKHKNFKIYFGYTISPHNIGCFAKTLEEVEQLVPGIKAADFHINLFQVSGIYYSNLNQMVSEKFTKAAIEELDAILRLRKKDKLFDPIFMVENKYLQLGKKYLKRKKMPIRCNIYKLSCFIDPQGNVFPCSIFNCKLGNLRDSNYDLKKVLNSDTAKKVSREIAKGNCPQCWTPCEAHQLLFSNWLKSSFK